MIKISPSILAGDFLHLEDEIKAVEQSNVDYIHLDIMDGHFVPNITYGFKFISAIKKISSLPADAHLMITNPDQYIDQYAEAGCDIITFHYEVTSFHLRTIDKIKKLNKKAGISINPTTPVEVLKDLLWRTDLILLMSVEPGFYGQDFIKNSFKRIDELKNLILKENTQTIIEVDGGVGLKNYKEIIAAGADILVIGNDYFKQDNYKAYVDKIKQS